MTECTFLQELSDGGALYSVPAGGAFKVGAIVKSERAISPDHEAQGEVLATTDAGAAIVHWPTKKRKPPAPQRKEQTPMTQAEKLEKAAASGLHEYADRATWAEAMQKRAVSLREEGETTEQAAARLYKEDATMKLLRRCYEAAS